MNDCPVCAERARRERLTARPFNLRPQEVRVVMALLVTPGEVVGNDVLLAAASEGRHVEPPILKVLLHRIRARLKPHGVTITNEWGVGYVLSGSHDL